MANSRLRRLVLPLVGALALGMAVTLPAAPASAAAAVPKGTVYVNYTAKISAKGSGTGYSSYLNIHDAHNNAFAFGIQSDTGSTQSRGKPRFIWERVQNGKFSYGYLSAASNNLTSVGLRWYKNDVAAVVANGKVLQNIGVNLDGRLFFNAEANARLNGDTVHSTVQDISIKINDTTKRTGLAGKWNTGFAFHGLRAKQTKADNRGQGASFAIDGTVSGLARGHDWDSDQVSGIAMIAQNWG